MHVMIDLETLSRRPDATILQIAAVEFEPVNRGSIYVERALVLCVDCHKQKRHVDPATVDFWQHQTILGNAVFRDSFVGHNAVTLKEALVRVMEWWRTVVPVQGVWSHGAAFDIPILTHAYMDDGYPDPPWDYRDVRDTRTYFFSRGADNHPVIPSARIAELEAPLGGAFREHNALDDAVKQCLELQAVMR